MPDSILDQVRADHEAQQDEAIATQRGFDFSDLQLMVDRWGIRAVLSDLQAIQEQLPGGSQLEWRILSPAYLTGGYDDPNPCGCATDEF